MTKALTTSGAPDSSAPRSSKRLRLLSVAALGLAAGVALSGCSSSGSSSGASGRASGPATGSASVVATPSASGTGSSGTGTVLKLDETTKGHTVHVPVGGTVLLTMHNITWSTPQVSNPADLSPLGLPEIGPGTDCHPGSGCGTKSTRFVARQAGTVTITETRTSCGEARRCTDGQGTYSVTVVIG